MLKTLTSRDRRVWLKRDLRMSFMACTKSKKTPESPHVPSGVNQEDYMRIKNSHSLFSVTGNVLNILTKNYHIVIYKDVFNFSEMI